MTPIEGVDYAFAPHPSVAALKAAGKKFAVRYVGSKDYSQSRSAKWLNPTEYQALRAAGLDVVVVFEYKPGRAEDGKAAGVADAKTALKELKYCGLPADTVVYMAVDYDTTVGPNITGYLQGAASVLSKSCLGVYGSYKVVKGCLDAGLVTYAWQTYAWSGTPTQWDKRAQLQQYANGKSLGNASVDYTRAMFPDFGQVGAVTSNPPSAPKPKPKGVTRAQFIAYMKTFIGTYGPPNNDNIFNTKYYGHRVSGNNYAWCVVFAWYCWNHFGIADENGGKFAGVPAFKAHFQAVGSYRGNPTNTDDFEPGDPVAYDLNGNGGGDHFGTVVEVLSSTTFKAIEGNTSGKGNDDVAIKTRSVHQVVGHAKLLGVVGSGSPEEAFMGEYNSIDKNASSRQEVLTANEWKQVYFNQNNSAEAKNQHAEGDYPSLAQGHQYYSGTVSLVIKGLPENTKGRVRCVYTDAETNEVKASCDQASFVSDDVEGTPVKFPVAGYIPTGLKLRVEVTHRGTPDVSASVVAGYARLFVKEA